MAKPEPVQPVADRGTGNFQPVIRAQFPHQIIQRQVALVLQPGACPTVEGPKLAPAAIALWLWFERPGLAFQNDHIVNEFDRNPEMRCCRVMRVPVFNKRNNPLAQLYRMWFALL